MVSLVAAVTSSQVDAEPGEGEIMSVGRIKREDLYVQNREAGKLNRYHKVSG